MSTQPGGPSQRHPGEAPPRPGGEEPSLALIERPARGFVWPPGRASATAVAPPPWSGSEPASRRRGWWRQIEETWLGLTCPPFADRALEANWQPDHPTTYCPGCARRTGPYEADEQGCAHCRSRRLAWNRAVRLGDYSGLLRDALHDLKFTAWRRVGHDLGSLLGVAIADTLSRARIHPDRVLVVPMPTTYRRRMMRGIDHSFVLARAVAEVVGCSVCRALDRRHVLPQTALPASERAGHVRGTMWRQPGVTLSGRVVLVVDDIMTTGSTMFTACRGLRRRPGGGEIVGDDPEQIWACVVGVTPVPGARSDADRVETAPGGVVSGVHRR